MTNTTHPHPHNHPHLKCFTKRLFKPAQNKTEPSPCAINISAPILVPASPRRAMPPTSRSDLHRVRPMPSTEYPLIIPSRSPAPARRVRRNSSVGVDDLVDDLVGYTGASTKPKSCHDRVIMPRSHSFSASGPNAVLVTMEQREWEKMEKMRAFEDLLAAKAEITIKFSLTPTLAS